MMLSYSSSCGVSLDVNFIDYFVHKTVKSQLSPHLPYKEGWGGVGWGIRGMKKGLLLSQY